MEQTKRFFAELPASIETLDFHIGDIFSNDAGIEEILAATRKRTPQFICQCDGNGINNDWICSKKFVYKVPYLVGDEEIPRIEMEKMASLGIQPSIITSMIDHSGGEPVCFDLGSEVWLLSTHEKLDIIEYGNKTEDIQIPDLPRTDYTGIFVRAWLVMQNPQTFNYGPYMVQTGPGSTVILSHNGAVLYDSSAEDQGQE